MKLRHTYIRHRANKAEAELKETIVVAKRSRGTKGRKHREWWARRNNWPIIVPTPGPTIEEVADEEAEEAIEDHHDGDWEGEEEEGGWDDDEEDDDGPPAKKLKLTSASEVRRNLRASAAELRAGRGDVFFNEMNPAKIPKPT